MLIVGNMVLVIGLVLVSTKETGSIAYIVGVMLSVFGICLMLVYVNKMKDTLGSLFKHIQGLQDKHNLLAAKVLGLTVEEMEKIVNNLEDDT